MPIGRVLSPVSVLSEESTVDQLINRDSRWWNSALVDLIFIPCEAQLIKSIPVCLSAQLDFLVWPHSRTGMYQVRSGYHLLCESHGNEVASSSDTDAQRKFWNSLWKLNILNKGRNQFFMPSGLVRLYVQCGAPISQFYPLNFPGSVRSGTCLSWWSVPH
nr:hypothetical protein CFP56_46242 [Quercus suber]